MTRETNTKSGPHAVDIHVGKRLRQLRLANGMSQAELAEPHGISFQQIQKYERGMNRIAASRLLAFAIQLGIDVNEFYLGLPGYETTIKRCAIHSNGGRFACGQLSISLCAFVRCLKLHASDEPVTHASDPSEAQGQQSQF